MQILEIWSKIMVGFTLEGLILKRLFQIHLHTARD